MDRISRKQRSSLMSRVKQRNTKPELLVRSLLFAMRYRFRLSKPKLPGRPDIIFSSRRKVIFVHGCFWHGHSCPRGRPPSSNVEFWSTKIAANITRDHHTLKQLGHLGWSSLVLWECELKDRAKLEARLEIFLQPSNL